MKPKIRGLLAVSLSILTTLSMLSTPSRAAQQLINVGTTGNDGTGDPVRSAFIKANTNFTELYNLTSNILGGTNLNLQGDASQLTNTPSKYNAGTSAFSHWGWAGQILSYNQSNYDTAEIRCLTQLKRGTQTYVFYGVHTSPSANDTQQIAYAVGSDFYNLTPSGIALTTTPSAWDSGLVGGPRIYTENGTNYMYYFGGTNTSFEGWPISIGVATQPVSGSWTPNGWTKFSGNPLITKSATVTNCWRPWLIKYGKLYYLFYNATYISDSVERINVALSSSPLGPFTNYSGNPILADNTPYTQDPCVVQQQDGNFMMIYSQCCVSPTIVGTAWSPDLLNWTIGPHAPIDNLPGNSSAGFGQSFDLFWDANGPCVMWDNTLYAYLARPNHQISADKYNFATGNITSTNIATSAAVATNVATVQAHATSLQTANIGNTGWVLTNYFSPLCWFKADSITGLTNGAPISTWNDSSGNALNATPATTNKDTWNLDQFGLPYVLITNNAQMITSNTTLGTNITICVVAACPWTVPSYRILIADNYTATTGISFLTTGSGANGWSIDNLVAIGNGFNSGRAPRAQGAYGAISDNTYMVMTSELSAGLSRIWTNGVICSTTELTGSVPNAAATPIQIGCSTNSGDTGNGWLIREVMIFPIVLSDQQRQYVESYLATKWMLSAQLPATNTFNTFFGWPLPGLTTANTTSTVTFNNFGQPETQYNTSGSTIASLTINLPSTTANNQICRYTTAGACTAVTVNGTVSAGAGVTSLSANSTVAWQAVNTIGSFVRIQ